MSRIALIDADIVAFRVAASCQTSAVSAEDPEKKEVVVEPVEIGYARVTEMMDNILLSTGATRYEAFLTDSAGNFRKQVDVSYKANRKPENRPVLLPALEEYLIKSYGAVRAIGEEADDKLGIRQTECTAAGGESVICSIDKDLHQIPGLHFNFVKNEATEVTEDEGQYFFYKQLLMGDTTDNIAGCVGIGPKKADKALLPCFGNEERLMQTVWEMYEKCYPDLCSDEREELITTVGRLVYIRRHPGELWNIPKF